jgi:hypothetical protein
VPKILFACFHSLERGTVAPVARRLRFFGHETGFLGLWSDDGAFPVEDGVTFRRHESTSIESTTSVPPTLDLIRQALPGSLNSHTADCLARVIHSLHPEVETIFPLRVKEWVPRWRSFVDEALNSWRPNVVVLSLGQLETAIVRRACAAAGIPCLFLVTPFYEFKCLERLPLLSDFRDLDEYCVASSVGQSKLRRSGIPAQNIVLTGAPQLDPLTERSPRAHGGAGLSILYADQRLEDNQRLGQRLLQYVADHPGDRLLIRLHPTASESDRAVWQKELDRWPQNASTRLSPIALPLIDDLASASVVVSISSLVLYESILWGRPALSWCPGILPSPLCSAGEFTIPVVRTASELAEALDHIRKGETGQPKASLVNMDDQTTNKAADSVCRRIIARLPPGGCPGTRTTTRARRLLSGRPNSPPRTSAGTQECTDAPELRTGLAILTYVPTEAPSDVRKRLPAALTSLHHSGYEGPLFVVDDGSTDPAHLGFLSTLSRSISVVRRPRNGGISRAKNTCLRVLMEIGVDVGFIAEDDIAFYPRWHEAYVSAHCATQIHHFSWAWDEDPSGCMRKEICEVRGHAVTATTLVNGVLLSFTPHVVQTVGGFKVLPAPWGHEHTHWTSRIIEAGLAPFFADIIESNRYIGLNRYADHSAIPAQVRPEFSGQNAEPAGDVTTLWHPLIE